MNTAEMMVRSDLDINRQNSLTGQIGNTPLLKLRRITPKNREVELYVKAEWFNPGGSVKDRPAFHIIASAIRSGKLSREKTILDATSGNTGIAYAMIGRVLGYRVALALPANASQERKQILRAYGAELILTDPLQGTDGAQLRVRELIEDHPEKYVYLDQYNNPANWKAHYTTTAAEIWHQTAGRVTHFVAGLGTTGTFMGTTRRLKELNPRIQCISFQPDSPLHGLEGLKHMESVMVPGIYDPASADQNLQVSTEEAYEMVVRLVEEEGLFVGLSSGAALAASLKVADNISSGLIVTVFPDSGVKYLDHPVWDKIRRRTK